MHSPLSWLANEEQPLPSCSVHTSIQAAKTETANKRDLLDVGRLCGGVEHMRKTAILIVRQACRGYAQALSGAWSRKVSTGKAHEWSWPVPPGTKHAVTAIHLHMNNDLYICLGGHARAECLQQVDRKVHALCYRCYQLRLTKQQLNC